MRKIFLFLYPFLTLLISPAKAADLHDTQDFFRETTLPLHSTIEFASDNPYEFTTEESTAVNAHLENCGFDKDYDASETPGILKFIPSYYLEKDLMANDSDLESDRTSLTRSSVIRIQKTKRYLLAELLRKQLKHLILDDQLKKFQLKPTGIPLT